MLQYPLLVKLALFFLAFSKVDSESVDIFKHQIVKFLTLCDYLFSFEK